MDDPAILRAFSDLLETETGTRSPESNRSHLKRVIARESRTRGISAEVYLNRCRVDAAERQRLVDGSMIGETYFFREAGHFRYLSRKVLPALAAVQPVVTAWSASCSTGEEAVSLAVLLDTEIRRPYGKGTRVIASDVRADAIARIAEGRYPRSALRRDGTEFHELFCPYYDVLNDGRTIRVQQRILDTIRPIRVNLFDEIPPTVPDDIDIVFFRNTLIYADKPNRDAMVAAVVSRIRDGGYLFLANSELPFVEHPDLSLVEDGGIYCFRKRPAASAPPHKATPLTESIPAAQVPPAPARNGTPTVPTTDAPAADAPPPTTARAVTLRDVAEVVERWPHAGPAPADADPVVAVAAVVIEIYAALDEDRIDHAGNALDRLSVRQPDTALTAFCTGWYHYCTGDEKNALDAFRDALQRDPSFWPARFYRGKLRVGDDPAAARRDFESCLRATDGGSAAGEFRFFLGGFGRKQINELARKWLSKIEAEMTEKSGGPGTQRIC